MAERVKDSVSSYVTDSNGVVHPVDCEVVIREIPVMSTYGVDLPDAGAKQYEMIASVTADSEKILSDTLDVDNTKARATMYMRMTWLDRSGTNNAITWLEGNVTIDKGNCTSGFVYWGSSDRPGSSRFSKELSKPWSFSFNPNFETSHITGLIFARYMLSISGNSYNLTIQPTIFD